MSYADKEATHRRDGGEEVDCRVGEVVALVGGKWKLLILHRLLYEGTFRFNQLQRRLDGISQRMLTNQLRELERDGLAKRKVYPEVPPKVEYSATEKAVNLKVVFEAMHTWGVVNLPRM